jgi:glycosyltransferase involved in cell wall biosynthesis
MHLHRMSSRTKQLAAKWLRRNWPQANHLLRTNKVAIAVVNYNTAQLVSLLLFSLFRVLGKDQIARIVVVDNASTDDSSQVLSAFQEQGLIDVIFNRKQQYHGPALNQAIEHLARITRAIGESEIGFDYVWILDSDVIVLRRDTFVHAAKFMEDHQAAAVGEFQYDHHALPEGYAHISSLLIDPEKVWRRSIDPFENSGAPAGSLYISLRRHSLKLCDFPFRSQNYVLHLGRGTLKAIVENDERNNQYYAWATQHSTPHYHGNRNGALIFEEFLKRFHFEVPSLSPQQLIRACLEPAPLDFDISSFGTRVV